MLTIQIIQRSYDKTKQIIPDILLRIGLSNLIGGGQFEHLR